MLLVNRDDGVDQFHAPAMGDQIFNLINNVHLLKVSSPGISDIINVEIHNNSSY
jgi:hypothetical protein